LPEALPDEFGATRRPTRPPGRQTPGQAPLAAGYSRQRRGEAGHGRGQEGREKQLAMRAAHLPAN